MTDAPAAKRPDPARPSRDPDDDRVDVRRLRAVAHPVRVRILELLRIGGPSTCTRIAAALGNSTASTSYHLRKLDEGGFIAQIDRPEAGARERWWKAVRRSTRFDQDEPLADIPGGEEYVRAVAETAGDRVRRFLDDVPGMPLEWQRLASLSDWRFRLTADELRWLHARLAELVDGLRRDGDPGTSPDDGVPVTFQYQVLPHPEPDRDGR